MPQRPEGVTAQNYFPEVHWAAVETSTVPPAPIPGICYGYANPLVRTTVQNGRETGRHREASLEAANTGGLVGNESAAAAGPAVPSGGDSSRSQVSARWLESIASVEQWDISPSCPACSAPLLASRRPAWLAVSVRGLPPVETVVIWTSRTMLTTFLCLGHTEGHLLLGSPDGRLLWAPRDVALAGAAARPRGSIAVWTFGAMASYIRYTLTTNTPANSRPFWSREEGPRWADLLEDQASTPREVRGVCCGARHSMVEREFRRLVRQHALPLKCVMMSRSCGVPGPAGTAEEEADLGALTDAGLYGHVDDDTARNKWLESQRHSGNRSSHLRTPVAPAAMSIVLDNQGHPILDRRRAALRRADDIVPVRRGGLRGVGTSGRGCRHMARPVV